MAQRCHPATNTTFFPSHIYITYRSSNTDKCISGLSNSLRNGTEFPVQGKPKVKISPALEKRQTLSILVVSIPWRGLPHF